MTRLNGRPAKPGSNAPMGFRCCQWCGEDFAVREQGQAFCCTKHRAEFNNMRRDRGALIYDLLMTMRYERGLGAQLKLWSKVCTILANFRREDHEKRASRHSWQRPKTVIERRPDLLAKPITTRRPDRHHLHK